MTIDLNVLDANSINQARFDLQAYAADLQDKAIELCSRLATIGAVRASLDFSRAIYNGNNDVAVSVEPINNGYAIHARGGAVLFIEFGSGSKHGGGHPRPEGYGPGTYNPDYPTPENPNWRNPKGWWYGDGQHTYGNPPAAAMWNAEQDVLKEIETVAREVFS